MYVPITTFNIGYPHERPWKRLLKYYSTTFEKCKGKFLSFGRSATKISCTHRELHPKLIQEIHCLAFNLFIAMEP